MPKLWLKYRRVKYPKLLKEKNKFKNEFKFSKNLLTSRIRLYRKEATESTRAQTQKLSETANTAPSIDATGSKAQNLNPNTSVDGNGAKSEPKMNAISIVAIIASILCVVLSINNIKQARKSNVKLANKLANMEKHIVTLEREIETNNVKFERVQGGCIKFINKLCHTKNLFEPRLEALEKAFDIHNTKLNQVSAEVETLFVKEVNDIKELSMYFSDCMLSDSKHSEEYMYEYVEKMLKDFKIDFFCDDNIYELKQKLFTSNIDAIASKVNMLEDTIYDMEDEIEQLQFAEIILPERAENAIEEIQQLSSHFEDKVQDIVNDSLVDIEYKLDSIHEDMLKIENKHTA